MENAILTPVKKSKEYKLALDNRTFKVKLSISSSILLEINELEKIMNVFYEKSFSLENLINLSKGFRVCENIDEAYDIFEEIFEAKKAQIKNINENSILLVINVSLPGGKIQQAELELNKKEMNKNLLIENLVKKVNQIEEELKNKVNKLEEENKNLKNEIKEMKEKLNNFEVLFKEENKFKQFVNNLGIDSKIIDNKEELIFLINRLKINFPNQNNIYFKLLYRATRDGDNKNNFHDKINNKNSTLTIIQTTKGLKFGVFLEIPFKNTSTSIKDDNCFIFSLNLRKIYNSKKGIEKLCDYPEYYLNLWYQPICIKDNCLSNNNSYTNSKSSVDNCFIGFNNDFELNNYEQYFTVKEMETFQICLN